MKDLGLLLPIVTPCDARGDVDVAGLRALCAHFTAAGCHSLFAAGSTGRGPWFSRAQREQICRTVAECGPPDAPVFAGCMASGLPDMLDNARAMADAGADVAVLTAPGYFQYSQAEIEATFLAFADASPLPAMVYDIPAFAGTSLDMDMVRRLAAHPNVVGFKDSSGQMDRFRRLATALRDRGSFFLLQGKEHLLADALAAGASGFVVSLMHVDAGLFARLYAAARAGDTARAAALQETVTALMDLLVQCFRQRPETSTMFHFFNHILRKKGVCGNILLAHEGPTPEWIAVEAERGMEICERT